MTCGDRIRQFRTQKKISVSRLARELDVSAETVESWENGTAVPEPAKMIVLAAVLGTSADYLEKGEDAPRGTSRGPKLSGFFFTAALALYFVGYSSGEFSEMLVLGGTPLLYYGTSSLAIMILIGVVGFAFLGVSSALKARKR